MRTLKFILFCSTMIAGAFSYAGGTGGGGVLSAVRNLDSTNGGGLLNNVTIGNGSGLLKSEYVRFIKNDRSDLVFEYGQANERNELYTQTFQQRPEEFQQHETKYLNAIKESQQTSSWVKIK